MCNLRTFGRIERAVEQRMTARQMFTSFDITLALQRKGMRKLHREMRRDIRRVADELMWRFGYERTPVLFQQIGAKAMVYHPFGTDATAHVPTTCSLVPAKRGRVVVVERDGALLTPSVMRRLLSKSLK